ncbi:N-acetylmuramoyl-L-alanine amidase [Staphylococcus ratti]|uniref:N-acetylmuramoyl-L-alanine amidase n=1 Tax=Staphylococcus ratti TaxID=2892440 RepID=A0ABY3PBN3_9STAP|nr:N-acetylmuramoyl-L-alanine amidase [Staphylococcus ratti]UEX89674.1 N-acetylmuramoyl-L-alanine amidase [Staphylococcus ratti]
MKYLSVLVTLIFMLAVFAPNTYAKSTLSPLKSTSSPFDHPISPNSEASKLPKEFAPTHYPDVNQYIIQNQIKHSKVVKDSRMNTLPKLPYKYGTYQGIVIHEVGEDNSTLTQWVDRMYETYETAFVHAFVDNNEIHLTAPAEYYVWGAGKEANPYFYQIEVVRTYTFDDFAKSVNNQAWLAAYMLKQKNLTPTLADDNEGIGTIISHNAVGKYWGGTDHTDPIAYYAKWGYDMHQFFDLVNYHYNHMDAV